MRVHVSSHRTIHTMPRVKNKGKKKKKKKKNSKKDNGKDNSRFKQRPKKWTKKQARRRRQQQGTPHAKQRTDPSTNPETSFLFKSGDKPLVLPQDLANSADSARRASTADHALVSPDRQNLDQVINGMANSVIMKGLKDIVKCGTQKEYNRLAKDVGVTLGLKIVTPRTNFLYQKEILRFITWVADNKSALEQLCKGWNGLLRDVHPLKFQLYVLARAGSDLNRVTGRIGVGQVSLEEHEVIRTQNAAFSTVLQSWHVLTANGGQFIDTKERVAQVEEIHAQVLKLWATILEIQTGPEVIPSVSSTIEDGGEPPEDGGEPPEDGGKLLEEKREFLKGGVKLLESLSNLYIQTLRTQSQDTFLSAAMQVSGLAAVTKTAAPPEHVGHSTNTDQVLDHIRSASELWTSASNELLHNQNTLNAHVKRIENELSGWLTDAMDEFECSRTREREGRTGALACLVNSIRYSLAKSYLGHLKGIAWKPPRQQGTRVNCRALKSLDMTHAALVTLLDHNTAFFTYPGLKEAANTVSLAAKHKKLSLANNRGPIQRTALSFVKNEGFVKYLSDTLQKIKDKVTKLEADVKKRQSIVVKTDTVRAKIQILTEQLELARKELYICSSRRILWGLGSKTGARVNAAKRAALEAVGDSQGSSSVQISNDANDFKVKGNRELTTTISCNVSCTSTEDKTDARCLCCSIRWHIKCKEAMNRMRREQCLPLVGDHPGYLGRDKTQFGRIAQGSCDVGCIKITQQHRMGKKIRLNSPPKNVSHNNFCFNRSACIDTSLVENIDGDAVVCDVPLDGPLSNLKHGDTIAAIKYGSNDRLRKHTQTQLAAGVQAVAKYDEIVDVMNQNRTDFKTVHIYYLRRENCHKDIDGSTYLKWLQNMIRAWQQSLGPIDASDDMYLSEDAISNIGTHSARVTFAANAHDLGCGVEGIMKALDHKSLAMTLRYVLQSTRSRNGKTKTIQTMTSGQLIQPESVCSQVATKVTLCSEKPPTNVHNQVWRQYRAHIKSFSNAGCLRFQCPKCIAPYDERRFIAFSTKQALQKHLKNDKCGTHSPEDAKHTRHLLENAGVGPDSYLGTVHAANDNRKRLDAISKERGTKRKRIN